jgi:hypothetical protein
MWITLGPGVFLDTLRVYGGELVMLSEALAEKWNAFRQAGLEEQAVS